MKTRNCFSFLILYCNAEKCSQVHGLGSEDYTQRPKAPPAKAARTPNVILNKVYKANIP